MKTRVFDLPQCVQFAALALALCLSTTPMVSAQDIVTQPARIFGYGNVEWMALSADGQRIATAGSRGAFVWNKQTGELVRGFDVYKDYIGPDERAYPAVSCVAFSPDGTKLLAGTVAGVVVISSVESGQQQHRIALGESVQRVGFTPNGAKFLAAGYGRLWICDTETGRILRQVTNSTPENPTTYLSLSTDGSTVTFGGTGGAVQLWRVETGELIGNLGRPLGEVRSVAFSPDGSKLFVGGVDPSQPPVLQGLLMDVETGAAILRLETQGNDPYSGFRFVSFLPDGEFLLTKSGQFALWDANTGALIRRFGEPSDGWPPPVLSTDGMTVLDGERPNGRSSITEWDLKTGSLVRSYDWHVPSYSFWEAVPSPDGRRIFLAGYSGTWFWGSRIWDFDTGNVTELDHGDPNTFSTVIAYSAVTDKLLTGYSDGSVHAWDAGSGELVRTLAGHTNSVTSVAISPDGALWLSGGGDGARRWNAADGGLIRHLAPGCLASASSVGFLPDAKPVYLSSSCSGLGADLWDLEAGAFLRTLPGGASGYSQGSFYGGARIVGLAPDGKRLFTSGMDLNVASTTYATWIWDAQTGTLLSRFEGLVHPRAQLSPDGRWLLHSGSGLGNRATLLDATTGKVVRQFQFPWSAGDFVMAAFVSGGNQILTSGDDGTAWLWDIRDLNFRFGRAIVADDVRLRLALSGASGQRVRVQRSTNLRDWEDWKTVTFDSTTLELTDDLAGTVQRFYRAVEDDSNPQDPTPP